MVEYNSLYPVVHDLTDAEYSCCDLNVLELCHFNDCLLMLDSDATTRNLSYEKKSKRKFSKRRSEKQDERLIEQLSLERVASDSYSLDDEMILEGESLAEKTQCFDQVYIRTRQIACGSYSTVWETIHRPSGKRHATKIINRRQLTHQEDLDVYKEVAILSHLADSDGSCRLHEFFDEATHFYLVMDYYEGGNLQVRLMQVGRFDEDQVREMARSLLTSLNSIHKAGVCHRDVKLSNILMSGSSKKDLILCDFGSAERLDKGSSKLMEQCGTPSYVAPELIRGEPYDLKADIWSAGVVLYACMVGYLPFYDKTKRGLLKKIQKGDYRFDSAGWSCVSKTAKNFISQLLQVDPCKRPSATEALKHAWFDPEQSSPAVPIKPLKKILKKSSSSSSSSFRKKSGLRRVWFARPERPSMQLEHDDDDHLSICSHTLSSVSSADIRMLGALSNQVHCSDEIHGLDDSE